MYPEISCHHSLADRLPASCACLAMQQMSYYWILQFMSLTTLRSPFQLNGMEDVMVYAAQTL